MRQQFPVWAALSLSRLTTELCPPSSVQLYCLIFFFFFTLFDCTGSLLFIVSGRRAVLSTQELFNVDLIVVVL